MRSRIAVSRIVLPSAAAVVFAACGKALGTGWDWNRMRTTPHYESYGASSFFRDGKAMQLAPAGTVPREVDTSATLPDTARGRSRYRIYCAVCHGDRADGISVVASDMDPPQPGSLLTPAVRALAPGRLDSIVAQGDGRMPSFGDALDQGDRRAVIAYLAGLERRANARGPQ
ncbi:MAG TPA: cytochrome c [Gemmatimonadales bacterium]|jgi:mono/diheme cytochrome c family protein